MKKGVNKRAWFSGAVIFFAVVALIIQVAVLVFDYIEDRTQNKGLIAILMLVIVFMLAGVCTVADIIRRRYMVDRPVKKILTATERIAQGDFSVRLEITHPYGRYDHYDLIMDDLNTMAAELEKTEVLKTDFISNVSHELKTPLTVIKSYTALLRKKDLDEETRLKYLDALSQATDRLNGLITNILRLNKLENQEIKPEMERFDLGEALGECVLSFEEIIEKKNIELVCEFDEEVLIYSSKSYLDIVWSNLLSNAVKFTDEGGRVEVKLKKEGEKAIVSVTDTGCGLSAESGARIFEKFYQGDTSHASEGNGLGLALVKKVIDVLGGTLSVSSEVGKGSTFTVLLKGVEE